MPLIIFLVFLYIFTVFFLLRFFIPHLGFGEDKPPADLPAGMEEKIAELKAESAGAEEFLQKSFNFIGERYKTGRFNTVIKLHHLFKSVAAVWGEPGFMPCTQSNYFLRIFLVKSGFFKNKDIKKKHIFFNLILHQYLRVKVSGRWVDADVGEWHRGMKIGKHLRYFG